MLYELPDDSYSNTWRSWQAWWPGVWDIEVSEGSYYRDFD